jgi:1-acylglycerone phosphate reductase
MSKSVLITGASAGGIGNALALEFQKRGLTVFATARSVSKMANLADLSNVKLLPLDVTIPSSVESAAKAVAAATGGKLDYLVNNSGQNYFMPATDVDIDDAKKAFDINFWGGLRTTQTFMPLLVAAQGTVVNIGSTSAAVSPVFMGRHNPFLLVAITTHPKMSSLTPGTRTKASTPPPNLHNTPSTP